ncbi:MAG: hypothetical protein ACKEQK_00235 [Candidatus Hodgkinia cicadicola]
MLREGELISNATHAKLWPTHHYALASGGAALRYLLAHVELNQLKNSLTEIIKTAKRSSRLSKIKRNLAILDNIIENNVDPQWIVLKLLPVPPTCLRPVMNLETNSTSDLNILYGRVINANNSLIEVLQSSGAIIDRLLFLKLSKELQNAVDDLLDTSTSLDTMRYNSVSLKSLTDSLKGKEGRFRQTLLGRRVDYSGRSVIIPGPSLRLWECGLPKEIALELFKPFIYSRLLTLTNAIDVNTIKQIYLNKPALVDSILNDLIKDRPVILNRAPTLHKLSMLAFKCVLITDKAIRLHPLVCSGFNADFDGDQMAVHVPLSEEAKLEAKDLLLATRNVLHPATGKPSILPSQDMVLGLYYASIVAPAPPVHCFNSFAAVQAALSASLVTLHTKVKFSYVNKGEQRIVVSTPGRLLITRIVPRSCEVLYTAEMPRLTKENLYDLVEFVSETCGLKRMSLFCEDLMRLGFKFVTKSGLSLCSNDFNVSDFKSLKLNKRRHVLTQSTCFFNQSTRFKTIAGLRDSYRELNSQLNSDVDASLGFEDRTAAQIILHSGSRGSSSQFKQIIGTRGQISSFSGALCKMPILSSYIEGLTPIQFFYSSCSSRRGLIDTVLKTATSGYFARKLVEACREYMITEWDCRSTGGITVSLVADDNELCRTAVGRVLSESIFINGKIVAPRNVLLTWSLLVRLCDCADSVRVRSPLTCWALDGLCVMCYGLNLSNGLLSRVGDSVGVIAAQAISEPGTQMTLRSFHGPLETTEASDSTYEDQRLTCAPCSGTVCLQKLACVRSLNGNTMVANEEATCSLIDNGKVVWCHSLLLGDCLLAYNGEQVACGKLICISQPDDVVNLSLTSGQVIINPPFGPPPSSSSVAVGLVSGDLKFVTEIDRCDKLLVSTGSHVDVFDPISSRSRHSSQVEALSVTEQGLTRLSKLFDSKPREIITSLMITKDEFDSLTFDSSNDVPYVAVASELSSSDNLSDDIVDMLSELDLFGFDRFVNRFLSQIQTVYVSSGIVINAKHIEVVLSRMLNTIRIIKGGQSEYKTSDILTWQLFSRTNVSLARQGLEQMIGVRMLLGISDVNAAYASTLSNVSFGSPSKSLALACLANKNHSISPVKDRVIIGKLPLIGSNTKRVGEPPFSF